MNATNKYDVVIGLEIHVQLNTNTKLFCADAAAFGAAPNTQVSPITLGHPGTLLFLNKEAVSKAVQMGIACNCEIEEHNYFARKNYFYPDLPKGYQVSQHTTPICKGGYVKITTKQGDSIVQLNRIHLEEDAGKSIHDADDNYTYLDYNRAGTPLIEIVTEPCISTAEEAAAYVTEIRKLVRWINVSDGNMEEGSLRCDANISIKPAGSTTLGTKVEVKNLNSIRNIKKAIEIEVERMILLAEKGERIIQQTRSFDASNDTTFSLRDKEEANDYRYFPEPDVAPFQVTNEYVLALKNTLPTLPQQQQEILTNQFGLSAYDALQITQDKETITYFLAVTQHTKAYKAIANWMNGPLKQYLNEHNASFATMPLTATSLAAIIQLVEEQVISFSNAANKLLPALLTDNTASAKNLAASLNIIQEHNNDALAAWVTEVLANNAAKVKEYQSGKKGLIGLFVGEVKKLSKGKADPKKATEILKKILNNN